MCIGVPMQVIRTEDTRSLCTDGDTQSWVDISLINKPEPGEWLLVFLGAAREVIDAEKAVKTQQALLAVEAVMNGEAQNLDHLFADLVDREPELPAHLKNSNSDSR